MLTQHVELVNLAIFLCKQLKRANRQVPVDCLDIPQEGDRRGLGDGSCH